MTAESRDGRRLADRVAIVTGAASGIGRATAQLFVDHGARVVMVDRDPEGLTATEQQIGEGAGVVCLPGDVSEAATARAAVGRAVEAFGQLDVLFNNAGIMTSGELLELDEDHWDTVLDVNLRSMYLLSRAALPVMLEQGRGAIVNTSSVMASLTEPGYEAYSSSKAGIIGLTKALAVSYASRGIRCNCVCPGWVGTPMNEELAEKLGGVDKLAELIRVQQPMVRLLRPREIAQAVLFLASDDASAVTGTALYVDGGASAAI